MLMGDWLRLDACYEVRCRANLVIMSVKRPDRIKAPQYGEELMKGLGKVQRNVTVPTW